MSDRDVARDIRREVETAGGSRWVPVRSVRDAFGRGALTRKARGEIAEALAGVGVLADPPLDTVELEDDVRLFLVETAPPPRRGAAPAPVWAPPPRQPGLWERFRSWPVWAQWAAGAVALLVLISLLAGGESSDDGGDGSQQSAQQTSDDGSADDAADRERARERKRARAKRKRERARERERIRERRRERRREEARERRRREREQQEPPAVVEPPEEEEPPDSGGGSGCDPNYSGCVPEYPPDVDCSDVDGPVTVQGSDPHGLDADGDGEGCES